MHGYLERRSRLCCLHLLFQSCLVVLWSCAVCKGFDTCRTRRAGQPDSPHPLRSLLLYIIHPQIYFSTSLLVFLSQKQVPLHHLCMLESQEHEVLELADGVWLQVLAIGDDGGMMALKAVEVLPSDVRCRELD